METAPVSIRFLDPATIRTKYEARLRAGASIDGPVLAAERRHRYDGETDLVVLAAAILTAMNRQHPLIDGNKRASICLTDEFLALNDRQLEGNEQELATLVWNVADNLPEDEVVRRLRSFVAHGSPDRPFDERYPGVIEDLAR